MRQLAIFTLLCFAGPTLALAGREVLHISLTTHREMSALIETDEFASKFDNNDAILTSNHIFHVITSEDAMKDFSKECREDLEMIVKTKVNPILYPGFLRGAILPMHDSAGKVGPAILRGHVYFAGHYHECKAIEYEVPDRARNFRTDYYRVQIDPLSSANASCADNVPSLRFEMGVCLPSSCSSAELSKAMRDDASSIVDTPVCRVKKTDDTVPEKGVAFYVTSAVMSAIVLVCVASGLVDFYFGATMQDHPIGNSLAWRLFMACSLYTNIGSIFMIGDTAKGGQIGPIHCIRFFSMCWVLLGHLFSNYILAAANPLDAFALAKDITSEAVLNCYFSVDSFFFISGVLLSFLWFKMFKRAPKETNSVFGWMMFYVHRILRISPAFYVLVFFYTFILPQLRRDTPHNMDDLVAESSCSYAYWVELVYLSNVINTNQACLGYSWYLAADMQMFLFTPLLLIPLAYKPVLGVTVAAVVFIVSTATNIFLVLHYHWPATLPLIHPIDPLESGMQYYNAYMYDSALIRCQIYIMGILVGWLLKTRKSIKIHPVVYLSGWVLGPALMLTVLLGLHDQTNGVAIDVFWRAMYSAFSRPAWGLGLSAILILCCYGYGGPINTFMSWHIWVPLGRLSYSAYLIHIPILTLVLDQSKNEVYFSNFIEFFITRAVAVASLVFFTATFWSACFEISFGRIEQMLLGGLRAKKEKKAENNVIADKSGELKEDLVAPSIGVNEISRI